MKNRPSKTKNSGTKPNQDKVRQYKNQLKQKNLPEEKRIFLIVKLINKLKSQL